MDSTYRYHASHFGSAPSRLVRRTRREGLAKSLSFESHGAPPARALRPTARCTSEIRIRDQIRSGRSLVGKGSFWRGHRLLSSGEASRLDGHPSVIAAVVATTGPEVFAKSSPAIFSGTRVIDLHTSAQDEQSRSLEVSVSAGVVSGDSSGHPHGQSRDCSCA